MAAVNNASKALSKPGDSRSSRPAAKTRHRDMSDERIPLDLEIEGTDPKHQCGAEGGGAASAGL
jgi:hypothetical protein